MIQGDFGAVSAQLRAGAEGLSPGASGMAAWLREQAAALEQTSAVLGKALADHRALPTDADPEVLRVLTVVRRYRVAVAGDAVLDVANELEEMARSLLAEGDAETARALCLVADRIDEGLERLAKAHPGLMLLPSQADPQVKRWQRITTINASDSISVSQRVALRDDWKVRKRSGLAWIGTTLDHEVTDILGVEVEGAHRGGVGGYQGGSEPTSQSEYRDADERIFRSALPACAIVGLEKRQREVLLSRVIPDDGTGASQARAEALATAMGAWSPAPTLSLFYPKEKTDEVLRTIQTSVDQGANLPDVSILETADGGLEVRFILVGPGPWPAAKEMSSRLLAEHPTRAVACGWAVTLATGSPDSDLDAAVAHWKVLARAGFSAKAVARIASRSYTPHQVAKIRAIAQAAE